MEKTKIVSDKIGTANMIDIFLPLRAGSERVRHKNTKKFADLNLGLFELKLKQVLKLTKVSQLVISTDDEKILSYLKENKFPKVKVHKRSAGLCTSETSTDDLIPHAAEICDSKHIFWTHVTSPFFDETYMSRAIDLYLEKIQDGYDSLMSVDLFQEFLFDINATEVNFDRNNEKWPRTQTLKPLYRVNSAAFIASKNVYTEKRDRIGSNPYLMVVDHDIAIDIDWPLDFQIAEYMYQQKLQK